MHRLRTLAIAVAFVASMAPLLAHAQEPTTSVKERYNVDRPDLQRYADATSAKDITRQSAVFRDVARGGKLGRLPARYTRTLKEGNNQIGDLLKGHDSVAELDPKSRTALDGARWNIIDVMVKFDPARVICSEVTVTGSRFPQTQCLSVYEAIERQKEAQKAAGYMINGMSCIPGYDGRCSGGG